MTPEERESKSVKAQERELWLENRRIGIGGSDIAVLLGLNPWKTEEELLLDKLNLIPKKDQFQGNAATKAGERLEPLVAQWWGERTENEVIPGTKIVHKDNPRFMGTTDFTFKGGPDSRFDQGILEIKTGAEKTYASGLPSYYDAQVRWYLMVSDSDFGVLSALIVPKDRKEIPFHLSPEDLYQWVQYRPTREFELTRNLEWEEKAQAVALRFLARLDSMKQASRPTLDSPSTSQRFDFGSALPSWTDTHPESQLFASPGNAGLIEPLPLPTPQPVTYPQ